MSFEEEVIKLPPKRDPTPPPKPPPTIIEEYIDASGNSTKTLAEAAPEDLLPGEVPLSKKYDATIKNAFNKCKLLLCKELDLKVNSDFRVVAHHTASDRVYLKICVDGDEDHMHVCIGYTVEKGVKKYKYKAHQFGEDKDSKMFMFDE